MQRYASMRDAYDSIYTKAPDTTITEALDTLLSNGIISEDEFNTLMKREETDLEKMTRQLKVSNAPRVKPKDAPPKTLGDKKVPGMMDHSKKND